MYDTRINLKKNKLKKSYLYSTKFAAISGNLCNIAVICNVAAML